MSTAASTDDVGSGTDDDVRSTAVVADMAAAAAAGAGAAGTAAVAAAVDVDDDDHADADDDDTSRYCIHPCHVPESRFTGSNASAIRREKRNGTIHRRQTYQSSIDRVRPFVPGKRYRTASAAFPRGIRGVFRYYSNKARERL